VAALGVGGQMGNENVTVQDGAGARIEERRR
jgi:hypothetical protein